jgi:TolB-like protein/Tfp pilus assembly protein PilF
MSALVYCFEDFTLDTERRELRHKAQLVPVEPQVFDLLTHLIRNRQRVVSRNDLLEAVWNGRIISESALSTRINAARTAIGDSGHEQRLIKTLLRKGFRFVAPVREENGQASTAAPYAFVQEGALPRPVMDRPSIVVLPFHNMSGDAEQEYFADGMVEEITTALSRVRWLFVIARSSSFSYKGKAADARQVGRELGVRYVLEGSVRRLGNRVRIAAQLIDGENAASMWADRFDGAVENVFDLQDQVATRVVDAVAPRLEALEIARARRKPTEHLGAYDHYLRGLPGFYRWEADSNDAALRSFYTALELDPDYAAPHACAAFCFVQRKSNNWMLDGAKETAEAARLAERAAELGKDNPECLAYAGATLAYLPLQADRGAGLIARALTINPNLASAWHYSGWVKIWLGEADAAVEHLHNAVRLSPRDPHIFNVQSALAHAYFFAGRYAEASSWAHASLAEHPDFGNALRMVAATAACEGRSQEAASAMERLRRVLPNLRVSNLKQMLGPYGAANLAKYEDALQRAGLPE